MIVFKYSLTFVVFCSTFVCRLERINRSFLTFDWSLRCLPLLPSGIVTALIR